MSTGQGSPFGGGSLLALAAMVAAGFTNLFKQLRRCQRFAYFPKHREMVLVGPDLVALFCNSGPWEMAKCHFCIVLRFPLNVGMLRY